MELSDLSYVQNLIIILGIEIPDLHIGIFPVLDAVVNHGQNILDAALEGKEVFKT